MRSPTWDGGFVTCGFGLRLKIVSSNPVIYRSDRSPGARVPAAVFSVAVLVGNSLMHTDPTVTAPTHRPTQNRRCAPAADGLGAPDQARSLLQNVTPCVEPCTARTLGTSQGGGFFLELCLEKNDDDMHLE